MKERMKHLLLFIIIVGVDQAVKFWIKQNIMNQDPLIIIPNILSLQYHENTGAVWGIMSGKVQFLSIFTLIILIVIGYVYFKIPQTKRLTALRVIVVFIMGGAAGNLIDRFFLGHVVDFIYFEVINFPLFNIADSCLTVSCVLILLLSLFYYKEEDFTFLDQLFGRKKSAKQTAGQETEDGSSKLDASDKTLDQSGEAVDPSEAFTDKSDKAVDQSGAARKVLSSDQEQLLFDRDAEEAEQEK